MVIDIPRLVSVGVVAGCILAQMKRVRGVNTAERQREAEEEYAASVMPFWP